MLSHKSNIERITELTQKLKSIEKDISAVSCNDQHMVNLMSIPGIADFSAALIKTEIIDIAPTMSALLGISFPNGATGDVLEFVVD